MKTAVDIESRDDPSSPSLEDRVDDFLPECPPLPETNVDLGVVPLSTIKRTLENTIDPNQSNVLVVGTANGAVSLFALGALNVGVVNLDAETAAATAAGAATATAGCEATAGAAEGAAEDDGSSSSSSKGRTALVHATLSKDIATLTAIFDATDDGNASATVATSAGSSRRFLRQFSTQLICDRKRELHGIALQCSHITALIKYLEALIKCMESSWESILLELNTKLTTFAQNSQGVEPLLLDVEFMSLLTSGIQSPELEGFLSRELSTRKLKTMGAAVEAAYGGIQKLVLEHMNQVTQQLMFRMGDLEGLACWDERFAPVGLDVSAIQECTTLLGSFALKSAELLNAIEESKSNFKAFFAWLQRVMWIIENDGGQVSPFEFDTAQVAQFIQNNFSSTNDSKEDGEAMVDVVGQYFAAGKLRSDGSGSGSGGCSSLWDAVFGEIVIDCPSGGCYAQVMKTIELGPEEGMGSGTVKSKLRSEGGVSSEAVDRAVEWLLEKGHVIVTGRGYLSLAAGPGQTQHTHLYPDMTSSSLAQVLHDLQAKVESSFALTSVKCCDSFSVQTAVHMSASPVVSEAGSGGSGVEAAAAAPSAMQAVKSKETEQIATVALVATAPNRLQVVKVDGTGAVQAAAVHFDDGVDVFAIQSYNDENFALMMSAPSGAEPSETGAGADYVLALIPLEAFEDHYEAVPPGSCVADVVAEQDGCDGHQSITEWTNVGAETYTMAVGGARQVGCTLAPNRRGLKIFDLGVAPDSEDEDDDGDDANEGGENNAAEDADAGDDDDDDDDNDDDEGDN